jgi:hypothetical protein
MLRARLLIASAVVEVGAGLLLLSFPAAPLALLLGIDRAEPLTTIVTRIAGAALLALGGACWFAHRGDRGRAATVVAVMLTYNVLIAALLAYAGIALKMAGVALWPVVGLHAVLAGWCVAAMVEPPRRGDGPEHPKRPPEQRP